jgi:hypothetical protein
MIQNNENSEAAFDSNIRDLFDDPSLSPFEESLGEAMTIVEATLAPTGDRF